MTSLERFRVRLLRSNSARLEDPAIKRWLKEVCCSVLNTDGNGTKFPDWYQHHKLSSLAAIFIRKDGWSLGAQKTQIPAAERMWRQNWAFIAEKPDFKAIPYDQWPKRSQLPIDWTSRANFKPETLAQNEQCKGCYNPLSRGRLVLTAYYFGRGGAKRRIAVCDDRCWARWNDTYWQAKADARDEQKTSKYSSEKDKRIAEGGYPVRGGLLP